MTITNDIIKAKEETKIQIVLTKPTPEEIIETFVSVSDKLFSDTDIRYFEADKEMIITKPWYDIAKQNSKYLAVMDHEDYSKKAFDMLIASIQLNGEQHFNMQMFMGLIQNEYEDENNDFRNFGEGSNVYGISPDYIGSLRGTDYSPFFKTTKTFNCDTVGCIAGFAVATALDWREDLVKKTSNYSYNQNDLFEHIACNFLNIPIGHGKKLFYADANSFWGMLKHYASEYNDTHTESGIRVFDDLCYLGEDEDDSSDDYKAIDLGSISPEMAVRALELLRDGHLQVNIHNTPMFSKDYNSRIIEARRGR